MKKESDSEPLSNKKYFKTKIEFYSDEATTNFHDEEIPKVGSDYYFIAVILIDFAL